MEPNLFSSLLFFYGLGLVTDEIIPFLRMPPAGDRMLELKVYRGALAPTLMLAAFLAALIALAFALHR
jgi:hypothetical protein